MPPLAYIVLRRGESAAKCSIRPLRGTPGLEFLPYPFRRPLPPALSDAILLAPDAPPLSPADASPPRPLLLLDASWHHAAKMRRALPPLPLVRSLPPAFRTAYPRSSKVHDDPPSGLATVEALHAALALLGRRDDSLLSHYPFAPLYLSLNAPLLPASQENASP